MGRIFSDKEDSRGIESANRWLTPDLEEQTARTLKGLCPHNKGWLYEGHSHNDDAYKCTLCGEIDYL